MSAPKVIVFGPTGGVGSATARTAAEKGAKVFLAMRDTTKSIVGLSASAEKEYTCERVKADLSDPASVYTAVSSTGAKTAFIYMLFGGPDAKPMLEALKRGGVTQVVFLSSFTVKPDVELSTIPPSEIIPYPHAQMELRLSEVFGKDGFVTIRPAAFATNTLRYKADIVAGKVKLFLPAVKADHVVTDDIGRVAGTILAQGAPKDGNRTVYLIGTRLVSNQETIEILARTLKKKIDIEEVGPEDAKETFVKDQGMSPAIADYFIQQSQKSTEPGRENTIQGDPIKEEWFGNIEKYSGVRATSFEEWAEQNKQLFAV